MQISDLPSVTALADMLCARHGLTVVKLTVNSSQTEILRVKMYRVLGFLDIKYSYVPMMSKQKQCKKSAIRYNFQKCENGYILIKI